MKSELAYKLKNLLDNMTQEEFDAAWSKAAVPKPQGSIFEGHLLDKFDGEIEEIKNKLKDEYGIISDRCLIKQLGIDNEGADKLSLWVRYQCAFSKRDGYRTGQDDLRYSIIELLNY